MHPSSLLVLEVFAFHFANLKAGRPIDATHQPLLSIATRRQWTGTLQTGDGAFRIHKVHSAASSMALVQGPSLTRQALLAVVTAVRNSQTPDHRMFLENLARADFQNTDERHAEAHDGAFSIADIQRVLGGDRWPGVAVQEAVAAARANSNILSVDGKRNLFDI